MKQLRFGANGGQRCTCAPSSLREPFISLFGPVNPGRSVSVVARQLYAFHQCCWHWPAQHTQAGLKSTGVSTSLHPTCSHPIFTQLPSARKKTPYFFMSGQIFNNIHSFSYFSFDMVHLFHHSDETSIGRLKWRKSRTNKLEQASVEQLLTGAAVSKGNQGDHSVDMLLNLADKWCESRRAEV